jgi:hypothetical protein
MMEMSDMLQLVDAVDRGARNSSQARDTKRRQTKSLSDI